MASGLRLDLLGSHRHEAALDLCPPLLQRPCPQTGLPWSYRCSWEPRAEVIDFLAQNHQAINEGHNLYGRNRASARSGCMKLNTRGSAARGELAIVFPLMHSPFRPLNIFVTVLGFPTRHVRNTCESISG